MQGATNVAFTTGLREVCTTAQQSCDVSDRLAGTYYYRVRGLNSWEYGGYSNVEAVAVLLPETPTLNPIDNADGDGIYSVTWSTAARAASYTLEEDTDSMFGSSTTVYVGAQASWNATGKVVGAYYYRVRAEGGTGQSGWSNIQSVSVLLPNTPTLNSIDNTNGDGNYAVTWNATARATSYVLQEDTDAMFSNPTTVYDGVGQSWSAAGKAQGTYYYRVRANGPTGQSEWSSAQSATVSPPPNVEITHIEYNPPGDDVQGEYVRIENSGGSSANMTGWTLRDDANHVFTFPTFTLNPSAFVRVWVKSGTNTATDLYWGRSQAVWNNTGDCAYLRNSGGTPIDTYCY